MISNKFIGIYVFITLVNGITPQNQNFPVGSPCTLLDGTAGVCKLSSECPWLRSQTILKNIKTADLPKLMCKFVNPQASYCCYDPSLFNRPTRRKSQVYCDLYRKERTTPIQTDEVKRVANGIPARVGEFPHMAALGYWNNATNKIDYKCGGSLISDRYILTAAHCNAKVLPTVVRLGTILINETMPDPEKFGNVLDIQVESDVLYPEYKYQSSYHDIALIRLAKAVTFGKDLHPACLYTGLSDNLPTNVTKLIATGWGQESFLSDKKSPILLKTYLSPMSLTICNRFYNKTHNPKFPRGLISGQFCGYDPDGMSDTCPGDSGGPLQFYDNSTMPVIVGVTSFGFACATTTPSVYTDVAIYLDWIESIVWPQ